MAQYSFIGIIYNSNSTGPSKDNAEGLAAYIHRKIPKQKIECIATEYAGHAEKLAYSLAKKHKNPLIISSSGDGGYHEVINGAMRAKEQGYESICAVLPSGNANDHRRTLRQGSLAKGIIGQKVTHIDLLHVEIKNGPKKEKRYAHSYIGLGLTPVIAAELNRHTLNKFREAWIVIKTIYKFPPFELEINKRRVKLDSLVFSNIHQMAKVLALADKSRVQDGKFEVTIFPHNSKLRLIAKLARAVVSHTHPNQRTDRFEFVVLKKMPMQLDGEVAVLLTKSKVTVTVAKEALATLL